MLSALCLGACGNTIQDQPIPHNSLESLLLAPYPVYWLGGKFHGLQITEASRDPSGAFTVQYGDCLEGGQSTCVPPLKVVTSPDNGFVPGEGSDTSRATVSLRGVGGLLAEGGDALSIPTGGVVLDVYAHTPALARAAAQSAVPINYPGAPARRWPHPCRTRAMANVRCHPRRPAHCARWVEPPAAETRTTRTQTSRASVLVSLRWAAGAPRSSCASPHTSCPRRR